MSSFFQTDEWRAFQEALGRRSYTDNGNGWGYVAFHESGTANTRLYTPYGPSFESEETFLEAMESLIQRAKRERATFIRIEPVDALSRDFLRSHGFRPVTYQQLQPAHTQIIDLTPSEDTILASMSQNSRNLTRNYQNKGISIRVSHEPSDISILTSLLGLVAARNHIRTHGDLYFQTQAATLFPTKAASLYIAEYEGKPIAAALVYDTKTTRVYGHAAADDTYRKLSAGTALLGQIILDAKRSGQREIDLYGTAPDDDPSHPWSGFTRFKKSFGGQPRSYVGAWDLPVNQFGYRLYRAYQHVYRKLR